MANNQQSNSLFHSTSVKFRGEYKKNVKKIL